MGEQVAITAIVCVLILLVEHYFPWQMVIRCRLPRLAAYVLGVLGIVVPLTWLFVHWAQDGVDGWMYLVALWIVVVAGGVSVGLSYVFDWVIGRVVLAGELAELMRVRDANRTIEEGQRTITE